MRERNLPGWLPAALVACGGIAVLALGAFVVVGALAKRHRGTAEREWEAAFGPREHWRGAPAPTEPNATALELEKLAAAIGVDLVPRGARRRAGHHTEHRRGFAEVRGTVGGYVGRLQRQPSEGVALPADGVIAYLERYRAPLDALIARLRAEPTPRWELDETSLPRRMTPNVTGQTALHTLLLADALAHAAVGAHGAALDSFDASWQLGAALRDDADLASARSSLQVARWQLGVLRQLQVATSPAVRALMAHDFRAELLRALQLEGWTWMHLRDPSESLSIVQGRNYSPAQPWVRALASATGPYLHLCAADLGAAWREGLAAFSAPQRLCDADPSSFDRKVQDALSGWNAVGRMVDSDLAALARVLVRLDLEREMTASVLDLRTARAVSDRWLDGLPTARRSAVCRQHTWRIGARDHGAAIVLDGEPWLAGADRPTSVHDVGPDPPLNFLLSPRP